MTGDRYYPDVEPQPSNDYRSFNCYNCGPSIARNCEYEPGPDRPESNHYNSRSTGYCANCGQQHHISDCPFSCDNEDGWGNTYSDEIPIRIMQLPDLTEVELDLYLFGDLYSN